MATKSFYETMVIDTPEAGANVAKAIEDYEKYEIGRASCRERV